MWKGVGPPAKIGLVVLAVAGTITAPRRVARLRGLAVAVPLGCLALLYSVSLPHCRRLDASRARCDAIVVDPLQARLNGDSAGPAPLGRPRTAARTTR
jgi:hypothetical protein